MAKTLQEIKEGIKTGASDPTDTNQTYVRFGTPSDTNDEIDNLESDKSIVYHQTLHYFFINSF